MLTPLTEPRQKRTRLPPDRHDRLLVRLPFPQGGPYHLYVHIHPSHCDRRCEPQSVQNDTHTAAVRIVYLHLATLTCTAKEVLANGRTRPDNNEPSAIRTHRPLFVLFPPRSEQGESPGGRFRPPPESIGPGPFAFTAPPRPDCRSSVPFGAVIRPEKFHQALWMHRPVSAQDGFSPRKCTSSYPKGREERRRPGRTEPYKKEASAGHIPRRLMESRRIATRISSG